MAATIVANFAKASSAEPAYVRKMYRAVATSTGQPLNVRTHKSWPNGREKVFVAS